MRQPLDASAAVTTGKLLEWALLDPGTGEVRSTRRGGRPITALKRLLVRLLAQYHGALIAEQTRFNVGVVAALTRLEERLERLERLEGEERRR